MGKEYRCFGPPGTGKTTWLASQVRAAAEKHGPDSVIVASLTRAAATEIAGRDLGIGEANVGTLHALCYRALGSPPIAETKLKEWNQLHPALALAGGESDLDEPSFERKFEMPADEALAQYNILRARMTPREIWPELTTRFALDWEAWMREAGYIDFTGMIEQALDCLPKAPGNPRIGFFDEMQDSSALELALIRKWGRHLDFFIVCGDDDQAIYAWRGSTPEAFLDPPIPDSQKRVLRQSYRVPRLIQEAASRWIAGVARREPKEYKPRDAEGEIRECHGSWRYVEPLVEDALREIERGRRVMVLASCSYMLTPLLAVLRQEGVPFHNPYRRKRGDWNPLGGGHGVSMTERILAWLRPSVEHHGGLAAEWTADDVRTWGEALEGKGVWKHGRKQQIEALKGRQAVDLDAILEHATEDAAAAILGMDLDWWTAHLMAPKRKPAEFPLRVLERRGIRGLTETPRLVVGTIHSVKGGEADTVYLVPDLSLAGMQEWLTPGEGSDGVRRMMYVALTRAKESLVLCSPATSYNVGRLVA